MIDLLGFFLFFFFKVQAKLRREGSSGRINIRGGNSTFDFFNEGLSKDVENEHKKFR